MVILLVSFISCIVGKVYRYIDIDVDLDNKERIVVCKLLSTCRFSRSSWLLWLDRAGSTRVTEM
jgi:hypothetical protein